MHLLVTGAWQGYKECRGQLIAAGHELVFMQWEKEPLPVSPDWVEGVICNGLFLSHPIEQFTNLRYIQLTSAGFDRVPLDYVKEHNIEIHNARGVYSIPMAEFAVGGVLRLYKQAAFFQDNQKEHRWEKHRGLLELYGKTVCIVGCGSVGTECARRFQAFGCSIIGIATEFRQKEFFDAVYPVQQLDEVIGKADIIVLSLPLTGQTRNMINADRFAKMKSSTLLVNISRGAVMDNGVLEEMLREKKISGAVLDVFDEEPLNEGSSLWDMENVIITPHNSFVGENNQKRLMKVILDNIESGV